MARKNAGGPMDRNAGMPGNVSPPPNKVRDTPIGGSGGVHRPSAVDRAAARLAGAEPGRQMKEADRNARGGAKVPKGKLTRKA